MYVLTYLVCFETNNTIPIEATQGYQIMIRLDLNVLMQIYK